jgi:hypothetical protein
MRYRLLIAATVAATLAGCGTPDATRTEAPPLSITPPAERGDAAVVRRPLPERSIPPVAVAPPTTLPPIVVPADAIYVCVVDAGGTRRQTVIEFVPKVHQLCSRHPEMGPCQYERNACRNVGGRVYAASGQEITLATEAEYDRKVMRVRFRAN